MLEDVSEWLFTRNFQIINAGSLELKSTANNIIFADIVREKRYH